MKARHLAAMLLLSTTVPAAPAVPGLLPTSVARPLLDQDPSVAAARASLEAARVEAGLLESSPYEWTARLSGQRRSLEAGPRYTEWNATIEKPWRLPAKAAADRDLATATLEEAEARLGDALHESARELASLWIDWLGAESARALAESMRGAAQENLAAVDKRVRAGDASKLDLNIAQGELAEQRRTANEASTQASIALARLQARFPGIPRNPMPLATPVPLDEDVGFWLRRILAQSDEVKLADAQWRKARSLAARARAERTPDPTVGLYTASEIGGQERIVGVTVSVPLPGGRRSRRADQAVHSVEAARQEAALRRRSLEAEVAAAVANVEGTLRGVEIADAGAAAMRSSAELMRRAYTLGEADLQALLTARRLATAAENHALAARVAALKARHLLLIDAHLVWDLEHDR